MQIEQSQMACPESHLGPCDEHLSSPVQVALHTPQQLCKSVWGGHYCASLTGKDIEARRSRALYFPGPFIFPVPIQLWVLLQQFGFCKAGHPQDDNGFINQRISECSVVRANEPETLELDV